MAAILGNTCNILLKARTKISFFFFRRSLRSRGENISDEFTSFGIAPPCLCEPVPMCFLSPGLIPALQLFLEDFDCSHGSEWLFSRYTELIEALNWPPV